MFLAQIEAKSPDDRREWVQEAERAELDKFYSMMTYRRLAKLNLNQLTKEFLSGCKALNDYSTRELREEIAKQLKVDLR